MSEHIGVGAKRCVRRDSHENDGPEDRRDGEQPPEPSGRWCHRPTVPLGVSLSIYSTAVASPRIVGDPEERRHAVRAADDELEIHFPLIPFAMPR
jgi:hypothetical protein